MLVRIARPSRTGLLVHGALAAAVVAEVVFEVERARSGSSLWLLDSAFVALAALAVAWWGQDSLRLVPVLLLAVGFHLALLWAHLRLGTQGDGDARAVYSVYGDELLRRHQYPQAEYPVGAVLLFAFEVWVGGGGPDPTETANGFAMVPFQLACVASIWLLRTRYSAWLATLVAVWPMNDFYWEYRFDLVPAALLVAGLLLAYRGRWAASGIALAVGEAVKWSPAFAALALLVWLLAGRRLRDAARFGAGFAGAALLLNVPFLLWNQRNYLNAYHAQGERGITNESIWYFPVRLLGLADPAREPGPWAPSGAPHWADVAAVLVQLALLAGLLVLVALARDRLPAALALAALGPVLFLLFNKIFSPQFLVVLIAAWAFAAALVVASRREQLVVGLLAMAATFANAFVFPFHLPDDSEVWFPYSAVMFVAALLVTGILFWRASPLALKGQPEYSNVDSYAQTPS
jgi:hypothetical protein